MGNTESYKLNYFNIRGRAEFLRIMLAYIGVPYEDNRIEMDKWPEFKAKTPFGQLPYLEINNGKETSRLSQTKAIARYLARKYKLYGKNEFEQGGIDMYADQISDVFTELTSSFREKDEAKKKAAQEKNKNETIPNNMKLFEARAAKSASGYLFPSGITWVDFYLITIFDLFGPDKEKILSNYPSLQKLDQNVRSIPSVAAWIANRPKTEI